MEWIKHDEKNSTLINLPVGTILKVENDVDGFPIIMVVGDGCIINNSCGRAKYEFFEPDYSSLGMSYKILEYAIPPQEYIDFYLSE